MRARRKGLTLIEVLIALAIFTVLLAAVTQGLLPVFSMTQKSQEQLDANQRAEQALNLIRSEWQDPGKYAATCVDPPLPINVEVEVTALDADARPHGSLAFSRPCGSPPAGSPPPAKRVTVRAKDPRGQVRATLVFDIREPTP